VGSLAIRITGKEPHVEMFSERKLRCEIVRAGFEIVVVDTLPFCGKCGRPYVVARKSNKPAPYTVGKLLPNGQVSLAYE
jgi:hypothetical protein